ncbi:GNAT family N-acetyltransferase [Actinoplanes solisilvae]|uniref:GNAT family N-acetyltransferase n=1 Tax=Actinoplanes solisilvae TaxID=2486853 RepID=UPI000FDA48D0|nr:GNAT family N-acetyltransferase [Actinoplanes solisilvae]
MRTEVLTDVAELAGLRAEWDALAVAAGRPYSAPGWALPWWSAARPPGAELRAIAVWDENELVGMAACYVTRDRFGIATWRLLADVTSSFVEPVAAAGRKVEVAAAIARAMRGADPAVDVLSMSAVPRAGGWASLARQRWAGPRPVLAAVSETRAPFVDLPGGDFDAWLSGRTSKFRKALRARQREIARDGGTFRRATTTAEMAAAVDDLTRLHLGRWQLRGGSAAITPEVVTMLHGATRSLDPSRLHLWTLDVGGTAVGAALFVAAGDEVHYWLGGFDEDWAKRSPSTVLLVEAVRHAAREGYRRFSLGPGTGSYKYRLATGEETLEAVDLVPRGLRFPYVRLCQSPYRFYRLAANHTPPTVKQRLRALSW